MNPPITQEAVFEDVLDQIRNTGINPMTDITKLQDLPDKWNRNAGPLDENHNYWLSDCARQLEAALPKWTTVTDDPDTQPKDIATLVSWVQDKSMHIHKSTSKLELEVGDQWRPLCDIDQPPEDM